MNARYGSRDCHEQASVSMNGSKAGVNTSKGETPPPKPHKTAILVLGVDDEADRTMLHVLGALGCTLPSDLRRSAEANPLADFEPMAVHGLNAKLFEKAGASFDDTSPFHPEWRQSPGAKAFVKHAVATLEDQFGNAPLIALGGRDIPRLFPLWAEALGLFGCQVRPIIMIRNPLESGRSSDEIGEFSQALAETIWLRAALDSEQFTRGAPRYFASFERLCQSWDVVVQDAQEALQLVWPKPYANAEVEITEIVGGRQFSKELQTRAMTSTLLPSWLRETYKILSGWAQSEEMAAHHNLLDALKGDFDAAATAFGRVIRAERQVYVAAGEMQRQRMLQETALAVESEHAVHAAARDSWASEKDSLVSERDAWLIERDTLIADMDALRAEAARLVALEEESKAIKATLQDQRRTTTLLTAQVEELKDRGDDLEAELRDARDEVAATRSRRKEMARVIASRDAQIKARYEELAQLQQQIVRSDPVWRIKKSFARLKRRALGKA